MLGEPPATQYDLRFQIFGIPIRVHPLFWLVAVLLGFRGGEDPINLLIWVGCVFISILVHELGHAMIALVHGWRPWITLYGFGGLASYQPTRHDARSQILISAAGPVAGFLFIAFVMAAVQASGHTVQLFPDPNELFLAPEEMVNLFPPWAAFQIFDSLNVNVLVFYLWQINILWGLLNLLPIYPLDGGQIMRELCLSANRNRGIEQSLWISIFVAGGVAILSIMHFGDLFLALMFGYLAYLNYNTLQRFSGRGGFGGGGSEPRGW